VSAPGRPEGAALDALARAMPKAELHMHLEGSLTPQTLFRLAERNGVALPDASPEELAARYDFDDLQSFLDLYYDGLRVLVTPEDFHEVTREYLDGAAAENVIHAEIYVSPQAHLRRGLGPETFIAPVAEALREAHAAHGMTGGIIAGIQRHFDEDDAIDMIRMATGWGDAVVAIGMGGPEVPNPPEKFVRAFEAARAAGFRTTAHAGEEGAAATVAATLDLLCVDRIDHGVRAGDDPALVARLADEGTPLTVCPLSNVALKVFPDLRSHNLKRLLDAGVRVTVNSDDPPYFGGTILDNFTACRAALGLTRDDLLALSRNAFEAAFVSPERRRECLDALERTQAELT
jgi:adenosine deaminase